MNRLAVFVLFFVAAWFVPAWPLLLVIGIVWIIAAFMSGKDNPPDEGGGDAEPESPPPSDFTRGWRMFHRKSRTSSKPFSRVHKR